MVNEFHNESLVPACKSASPRDALEGCPGRGAKIFRSGFILANLLQRRHELPGGRAEPAGRVSRRPAGARRRTGRAPLRATRRAPPRSPRWRGSCGVKSLIEVRPNNTLPGKPVVEQGWLVFLRVAPELFAVGDNLVGLRARIARRQRGRRSRSRSSRCTSSTGSRGTRALVRERPSGFVGQKPSVFQDPGTVDQDVSNHLR